jgi:predicted nucleic acid-binding protein
MVYLDTSVLVAYYYPEPISPLVEEFVRTLSRPSICMLTEVEFASALSKKVLEKTLIPEDASRIERLFQSHVEDGLFRRLMIDADHYQRARNWILQFAAPLRALDAIHLAVAARNRLKLASGDQRLCNAARHYGIDVKEFVPL